MTCKGPFQAKLVYDSKRRVKKIWRCLRYLKKWGRAQCKYFLMTGKNIPWAGRLGGFFSPSLMTAFWIKIFFFFNSCLSWAPVWLHSNFIFKFQNISSTTAAPGTLYSLSNVHQFPYNLATNKGFTLPGSSSITHCTPANSTGFMCFCRIKSIYYTTLFSFFSIVRFLKI